MIPISASNVRKSCVELKQLINDNLEVIDGLDILTAAQAIITLAEAIQ